jgi:hypothetical protein
MNDKRKSRSPNAIKVENRQKTIGIEDKLRVIMRREKGERIVNICHKVRLAHSDNADRFKKMTSQELKCFFV